jgi:hypothetical protein
MDFRKVKEKAFIDDEPIDVTPGTTAEDILRSRGHDPSNKNLVQRTPGGKPVILKPYDRINLKNGNHFDCQLGAEGGGNE